MTTYRIPFTTQTGAALAISPLRPIVHAASEDANIVLDLAQSTIVVDLPEDVSLADVCAYLDDTSEDAASRNEQLVNGVTPDGD